MVDGYSMYYLLITDAKDNKILIAIQLGPTSDDVCCYFNLNFCSIKGSSTFQHGTDARKELHDHPK